MVSQKTDPSLYWYLCGREDMLEGNVESDEIDLGPILEKIKQPDDVAKLCAEAAKNALSAQSSSSVKREWLEEEGTSETDWAFYLRGQIDELTDLVVNEVYEELRDQLDHDGDDGGAEEDDEEGADGEDEDDEDGEDELDDEP